MIRGCAMKNETCLFDIRSPYKINSARNANQGSIQANRIFCRILVTGLNRAF
jgi:hypothetical protein